MGHTHKRPNPKNRNLYIRGWFCLLSKVLDLCLQKPGRPFLQNCKEVDFLCNVAEIYINTQTAAAKLTEAVACDARGVATCG